VFTPKDFDLNDMLASVAELAVGSSDAVHA